MPRSARLILPNTPHHVTQRGNRRKQTFYCHKDYIYYIALLKFWLFKFEVNLEAFCLMPNHVHLILTPNDTSGITNALKIIHVKYTSMINRREGWSGHLWQGRFYSSPLKPHQYENAIRYVELNPVRANICEEAKSYLWSSAMHSNRNAQFYEVPFDIQEIRQMTRRGRPPKTNDDELDNSKK